jgi:hypothetical protein
MIGILLRILPQPQRTLPNQIRIQLPNSLIPRGRTPRLPLRIQLRRLMRHLIHSIEHRLIDIELLA